MCPLVPPKFRSQVAPPNEGKTKVFPFFNFQVMANFVYIIFSESKNQFYIGESVNPVERLNQHNSGFYENSRTKIAIDWELFLTIECNSKTQAIKLERFIKKMKSRKFILKLKENPGIVSDLLQKTKE